MVVFITPTTFSPLTAGSWIDCDVSSVVPAGATGVLLHIQNTNVGSNRNMGYRKNGSTDDRYTALQADGHTWVVVGVDTNRIFEIKIEQIVIDFIVVAYFTSDAVFFNNAVDKTPGGAGSYQDCDCSAEIVEDAVAACLEINGGGYNCGWRKNGSTDTLPYSSPNNRIGPIVGIDASKIFEYKYAFVGMNVYLNGYIKTGATLYTNVTDQTPGSPTYDAWTALTCGNASGIGVLLVMYVGNSDNAFGYRKYLSAETIYKHGPYLMPAHIWNTTQTVEYYWETGISFAKLYEYGYFTTYTPPSVSAKRNYGFTGG